MTETLPRWDVGVGYDRRTAGLLLQPRSPAGDGPVKRVPLAAIIRNLHIPPTDLATAQRDAGRAVPQEDGGATETSICMDATPMWCRGRVLDIGGYDGRYAHLCLERGADEAICLDSQQYTRYGWDHPAPLPGVTYRTGDFLDDNDRYDLVLFFNVAYHIKNPWQAFEHLRRLTGGTLSICSLITQDDASSWRLCAPREVNPEDDTVYWVPSELGLIQLLTNVGFEHVAVVGKAGDRLAVTAE